MDDDADDITESSVHLPSKVDLFHQVDLVGSPLLSPHTHHPLISDRATHFLLLIELIEGGSNAELDLKLTNRVVRQTDQSSSSSFNSRSMSECPVVVCRS
jgi:hypothetical protein